VSLKPPWQGMDCDIVMQAAAAEAQHLARQAASRDAFRMIGRSSAAGRRRTGAIAIRGLKATAGQVSVTHLPITIGAAHRARRDKYARTAKGPPGSRADDVSPFIDDQGSPFILYGS
jgi:hypothetical protein